MRSLRHKASKFFKRDAEPAADSRPDTARSGHERVISKNHSCNGSKDSVGGFNTFASDSDENVVSNIRINEPGSAKEVGKAKTLKKKPSLFSLFQSNKDLSDAPPVPALPSAGEPGGLRLSTFFIPPIDTSASPLVSPSFPPTRSPPSPPHDALLGSLDSHSHTRGTASGTPTSEASGRPTTATGPVNTLHAPSHANVGHTRTPSAPMTPKTFAAFKFPTALGRFSPSSSPTPKMKRAGPVPPRPERPSESLVLESICVSKLASGEPQPSSSNLTSSPSSPSKPSSPKSSFQKLLKKSLSKKDISLPQPQPLKLGPSSLSPISLPSSPTTLHHLSGTVTPNKIPEPLSALKHLSISTTSASSGSHYSVDSFGARSQNSRKSKGEVQTPQSRMSPLSPLSAEFGSIEGGNGSGNGSAHFNLDPGRISARRPPSMPNPGRPATARGNIRDTHGSGSTSPPTSGFDSSSNRGRSSTNTTMAAAVRHSYYPFSNEVPMERYDPQHQEYHFHSLAKDGKGPGELWRDDGGFLHFVPHI